MLRGNDVRTYNNSKQTPFTHLVIENKSFKQDSIHSLQKIDKPQSQIITNKTKLYSKVQQDSILKASENREHRLLYTITPIIQNQDTSKILITDTLSIKHSSYNYPFSEPKPVYLNTDNFMNGITGLKSNLKAVTYSVHTTKADNSTLFQGKEKIHSSLNWFTIAIVTSLFIFAFIKNLYNKYILQIVTSLVDYQVANRLYRERNVLFRNVSYGLHAIFYINAGLFVNYIFETFHIQQLFDKTIENIVINCFVILLIYNIKSAINKLIGYSFLVQEEFSEYIHNVNLFNKNAGLFLFPIIIAYPFVHGNIKPIILTIGIIIFSIIILLRFYRGFQIIMRKGASVFYLILYLCTIEILPVILLVKLTSTLI
jgi:hypothetical protein